jgi:hypothetical protein
VFLMPQRRWLYVIVLGTTVGLVTASVMSFLDWRLNPSGIFHSELGTNWRFVWDTWLSWFLPMFVVGSVAAALVFLWMSRRT